jgi:hypothetical protein
MLLISICLAWLVGIFLGSYWHLPSLWIICGLLPITSVFFFKQHRKQVLILALALVAFVGGLIYYPISLPKDILAAADYGQTEIEIQGIVGGPPEIKEKTTHLDITVQTIDGHPASGRVLLFVSHYPEYRYGDTILAKGRLSSVPILDGFDYHLCYNVVALHSIAKKPERVFAFSLDLLFPPKVGRIACRSIA